MKEQSVMSNVGRIVSSAPSLRKGRALWVQIVRVSVVLVLLYLLSYAPVVRACGRRHVGAAHALSDATGVNVENLAFDPEADSSLYPLYHPIDLVIDHTPLQVLLFGWANVWGVRDEFERGHIHRVRGKELNHRMAP